VLLAAAAANWFLVICWFLVPFCRLPAGNWPSVSGLIPFPKFASHKLQGKK
jgi:hypothetical protein